MTNPKSIFAISSDSRFAVTIDSKWNLVPLRIPTGWGVRHNGISARKLPTGEIEFNDSEDLFWAVKLPPPDTYEYSMDPTSPWRKIALDAGWYRDHFKIVVLDPDWDHVRDVYRTKSAEDLVLRLESWLVEVGNHGEVKTKARSDEADT
jgi:hypothetical protein